MCMIGGIIKTAPKTAPGGKRSKIADKLTKNLDILYGQTGGYAIIRVVVKEGSPEKRSIITEEGL